MLYFENVATHFQHHIEHLSLSVDSIAHILETTTERITATLLDEKKLFSCGIGVDAISAQLFCELMSQGLIRERPALPVIELASRRTTTPDGGLRWLQGQLQALGQPGDLAVMFIGTLPPAALADLATTLNKREVASVWIGAQGAGVSLYFPDTAPAINLSLCQASLMCLAELVDIHTFGPLENE